MGPPIGPAPSFSRLSAKQPKLPRKNKRQWCYLSDLMFPASFHLKINLWQDSMTSLLSASPLLYPYPPQRRVGELSCSIAHGIFPDQGWNPRLLHWQADSLPLSHQGSPESLFLARPHVIQISLPVSPCPFTPPGSQPGDDIIYSLFLSLLVPLGCDSFPDFSWFLMTLTGALVKYFVESLSIGDGLKLFSWGDLAVLMCLTFCFLLSVPKALDPRCPWTAMPETPSALGDRINSASLIVCPQSQNNVHPTAKDQYLCTDTWARRHIPHNGSHVKCSHAFTGSSKILHFMLG